MDIIFSMVAVVMAIENPQASETEQKKILQEIIKTVADFTKTNQATEFVRNNVLYSYSNIQIFGNVFIASPTGKGEVK
jgi:hypothetical protein